MRNQSLKKYNQQITYLHPIFAKYLSSNVTLTQRVFSHNLRITAIIDVSKLHQILHLAQNKKVLQGNPTQIKGYLTS